MSLNQDNLRLARGVTAGHAERNPKGTGVTDCVTGTSKATLCHFLLGADNVTTAVQILKKNVFEHGF